MDEVKLVKEAVGNHRDLIFETENFLWAHPETGYREWTADRHLKKIFRDLGYSITEAGDIPGFYAELDTGKAGPCIAILGEMDALPCDGHPAADPLTHAAHACGHHCQCAALVGVAAALKESNVTDGLCGKIRLMAVPAEEIVDLDFRMSLIEKGVIHYLQGKPEFIYRGYFDGVEMAMLIHAGRQKPGTLLKVRNGPTCGCIVKHMAFIGKAAHAGARPEQGVNALYAANIAMNAVNALRERFVDDDHIRFHPIVTAGGDAINVIPNRVVLESYLRGSNLQSMMEYNKMINQALAGAAVSIGAGLEIHDYAGSLPMKNDPLLRRTVKEAIETLEGEGTCLLSQELWSPGGTDLGNLSSLIPVVQPSTTGVEGVGHSRDFQIKSVYHCCQIPAECLVMMVRMLLKHDAARAREVLAQAQPVFQSKEEYFQAMESFSTHGEVVDYLENDEVRIHLSKGRQSDQESRWQIGSRWSRP